MASFGLIVEGQTDYAVLKNILYGFTNDPDLFIKELQPLRDATDASTFGGWFNVLEYCKSANFKEVLQETDDFIVIQIDTDCSNEKHYDVSKTDEKGDILTPAQLVEKVKLRFLQIFEASFGSDFWVTHAPRILFAIAVDEIECWILPLLYSDKNKTATNNCFYKLNEKLKKDNQNPIRQDKVGEASKYRQITKPYSKQKVLLEKQQENPSFNIFYEELVDKVVV
jgi:hypothetical protein